MSISEPTTRFDTLSDRNIVRIILGLLLASLILFAVIGIGGALGVVPNTCTGPGQRIMHARCEEQDPLATPPPAWEFYPGYRSTTELNHK